MDENINESAEIQEVAEPETEALESAETQEVAEPDTAEDSAEVAEEGVYEEEEQTFEKNDADAAFAEMRRNNQRLEREAQLMREALSRYFEGETAEELSDNAIAYAEERDPAEYRQEREQREEFESLKAEKQALEEAMLEMEVDRRMEADLKEIQAINPNVKSLDELGESFVNMVSAGCPAKDAYFAVLQMKSKEEVQAPDAIGRVADNRAERDYFTSEEIDNLTDEELANDEIYEKVIKSMERLYGKH